jgi:hypothetical protein
MTEFRSRHRASRLSAVAFLLGSGGIAVFSGVLNLFAVDVVAASHIAAAGPESWIGQPDAWQWDAITALGLAGALAAACITTACIHARRGAALAMAPAWAVIEGGLLWLVWQASSNTAGDLLLWQLAAAALLVAAVAMTPAER